MDVGTIMFKSTDILTQKEKDTYTIYLSNTYYKELISLLKDQTKLTGKRDDEIIMDCMQRTYMCAPHEGRMIAGTVYVVGVSKAISRIMWHVYSRKDLFDPEERREAAENGKEFIKYAKKFYKKTNRTLKDIDLKRGTGYDITTEIAYQIKQLELMPQDDTDRERETFKNSLVKLFLDAKRKPKEVQIADVFEMMLEHWNVVSQSPTYYDLLGRISDADESTGTAEDRKELIEIINSSALWIIGKNNNKEMK